MTTRRQQVVDAVVRLLNVGRAADIPEATTRRIVPSDEVALPAISVWSIEETRSREQRSARLGGPDVRTLKLAVQVIESSGDHDEVETNADRLVEHVDDMLGNTTLDGLAQSVIVDRITWEAVQTERTILVVTFDCLIQYQTTRGDSSRGQ